MAGGDGRLGCGKSGTIGGCNRTRRGRRHCHLPSARGHRTNRVRTGSELALSLSPSPPTKQQHSRSLRWPTPLTATRPSLDRSRQPNPPNRPNALRSPRLDPLEPDWSDSRACAFINQAIAALNLDPVFPIGEGIYHFAERPRSLSRSVATRPGPSDGQVQLWPVRRGSADPSRPDLVRLTDMILTIIFILKCRVRFMVNEANTGVPRSQTTRRA